jgi:mannose-1-phosphate guanylyltransferase
MKALILIGGEGTRLRPLTLNTLKCMVPIVNRRFFEYQFALLKKYGVRDIVLSICYLPERVQKEIGSGKKYGVRISYAKETQPLGTAGAIKNSEKYLDDTTIILNGDILTDIDLNSIVEFHKQKNAAATIALHKVDDPASYGLVLADNAGKITKFLEKPKGSDITASWINAGIYIFDKKVLDNIPAGVNCSVERQVFPGMIEKGEALFAFKSKAYWLDIGKIKEYKQANFDILDGRFRPPFKGAYLTKNISVGEKTVFEGKSVIKGPVAIGSNCKIGAGAEIGHSIIWDGVRIGKNSVIHDSIISNDCNIEDDCRINGVVIGDRTKVTKHSRMGE